MLKRNSKHKVLKSGLCTTLAALMLMPEINCFANKDQIKETVAKNKNTQNKISVKELEEKAGKIPLKKWLALALGAGTPIAVILGILKNSYGKNKSYTHITEFKLEFDDKDIDKAFLDLLKSVFKRNLTLKEISALDPQITGDYGKDTGILGIETAKLNELKNYISQHQDKIDQICNTLKQFYNELHEGNSNIYNPQKRYVLSYIIDRIHEDAKGNSDLNNIYQKLFQVNEELNRVTICNALLNDQNTKNAKKTIATLLFLEHLGVLTFNYGKEINGSFELMSPAPKDEFVSSALAYGETIMITMPRDTIDSDFQEIFTILNKKNETEGKYEERTSSHSFDLDTADNNYIVTEYKNNVIGSGIDCARTLMGTKRNQYGIDINVAEGNFERNADGTNGHILLGISDNIIFPGALIKLEISGPKKNSVFGHNHGLTGKGNTISSTCQFRKFSPHKERNGIHLKLAGINIEELKKVLNKFNTLYESNINKSNFLKKLTGPKMTEQELKEFLGINDSESDIDKKQDNDEKIKIIHNARNFHRFYESSDEMKEMSSLNRECGIMVFTDNEKNPKYTYYISDEDKFKEFIKKEDERQTIRAHQLENLPLTSGNSTCIQNISKTLFDKINDKTKNYKILDKKYLEAFGNYDGNSENENKQFLDGIRQTVRQVKNAELRIPGVTIYRANASGTTYYGYVIDDVEELKAYLKNDDKNIKILIALQNWWFWTSGGDRWHLTNPKFPKRFMEKLNEIKQEHTRLNHESTYVINVKDSAGNGKSKIPREYSWFSYKEWRIFAPGDDEFDKIKDMAEKNGVKKEIFDKKSYDSIDAILTNAGIK